MAEATERLRVGIVGLSADGGWAAAAHLPALAELDGFEVTALSASTPSSSRRAAERYGTPHWFSSVEDMAQSNDVDLVVIAVRVAHHRAAVAAAFTADKPVLCEWPLARNASEADELAAMAARHEAPTAVGLQGRSSPTLRFLHDLVADGYVGDVLSITLISSAGAWGPTFRSREPYLLDRDSGNTMLNVAVGHTTDSVTMCLGEFDHLHAVVANRRHRVRNVDTGEIAPMTTDDQIAVHGTLDNGAVAALHFRGGDSPSDNLYWEINGTSGDLVVTGDLGYLHFGPVTIRGRQGATSPLERIDIPARYHLLPAIAHRRAEPLYAVAHSYARLYQDLVDGTDQVPTFEHAARRHHLLDSIASIPTAGAADESALPASPGF